MSLIKTIEHNGNKYPLFQSNGNATRFYEPYALEVCKGFGVDVGCNRHEWMFNYQYQGEITDSSIFKDYFKEGDLYHSLNNIMCFPIDPVMNEFDALNFPEWAIDLDFIYSSNCLEHLVDYVEVLKYWRTKLADDGVLFMALPHPSQTYHRPESNRKHLHIFHPDDMKNCLEYLGYTNIFISDKDLYNGFAVMCNK